MDTKNVVTRRREHNAASSTTSELQRLRQLVTVDDLQRTEAHAEDTYQRAGFDPAEAAGLTALCRALTGTGPRFATLTEDACIVPIDGSWQVYVRRETSLDRAAWLVGHELAHWYYRETGNEDQGDLEDRCDLLGAALAVPMAALRSCDNHRPSFIADAFGVEVELAGFRSWTMAQLEKDGAR